MSLRIWLPLNGDLHNQGCSNASVTNTSATINTTGKIGSCYSFGTSKSYLKFDNMNFIHNFTECSVSLWLKILSWNTSYATFFQFGLGSTPWAHYIFGLLRNGTASTLCFTISDGSSATNANCLTPTLDLNTWYHLTFTYSNGHCKIYVNGIETKDYNTTIVPNFAGITTGTIGVCNNGSSYQTNCLMNDFRIYDHCLSAAEVKEIAQGLVLHYKLDGIDIPNENLGGTSANYSNKIHGTTLNLGGWGGDTGTVTFYHYGGYAGLPYKVYHKTTTGSGGVYYKTANDINLEANTTYTMSIWIKASRNFTASHYSFNINRGTDNLYITYGINFPITTEWQFLSKTFTTTDSQAGAYGEMSIIYDDGETDYYVYYSGFKIEKGNTATRWTPPGIVYNEITDSSGYNHNGTINSAIQLSSDTPRYTSAAYFGAYNTPNVILSNASILPALNNCTITWWGKYDTTKTLLLTGQSTSHYIGASNNNNYYHSNAGSPVMYKDGVSGTYKCAADGWHFFALTGVDISTWTTLKINGYGSGFPLKGYISDFRIYCTQLLDTDIKQLYNVSMKVDNQYNIHAFEMIECNVNKINKNGQAQFSAIYENGLIEKLHYDKTIYTEPDGSTWARVFHHNDPTTSGLFVKTSDWEHGVYESANKWYDIEQIIPLLIKYEFMVKQKTTSSANEVKYRWIQTANPLTCVYSDVSPGHITVNTSTGYTNSSYGGLWKMNSSARMCIANSSASNWYGAMGSWTVYNTNNVPGYPNSNISTGYLDFYVRVYPNVKDIKNYGLTANQFIER